MEAVLAEESKEALWQQLVNEILDEIVKLPAEKFSLISEAVKLYSAIICRSRKGKVKKYL